MKKLALAFILFFLTTSVAYGQATHIQTSGTIPTSCTVGDIYVKTGASIGFYACTATNTWTGPYSTGAGAGTVTHTGSLTANQLVLGNGTADLIPFGGGGTTTTLLHGNAAGAPTFGAVNLGTEVTSDLLFSNLTQGSALSVLGVTGNSTADVASIAAGTDNQVLRRSGTSLAFGTVNLSSSDAITGDLPFANLTAATGASKILGRGDSGAGDFQELTLGTGLYMAGTALSSNGSGVPFNGAKARKSVDQTGADYTAGVVITWNTEDYDSNAFHDNSSNTSRMTIPSGVTKVKITFSTVLANVTVSTQTRTELFKNGTSVEGGDQIGASIDTARIMGFSVDLLVTAGDYFEVKLTQQTDTSIDVVAARTAFQLIVLDPPGGGPSVAPFLGAKVRKSADLTGQNVTSTHTVAWNSEDYDVGDWHDTVTNNSRLTVPAGVAKVRVCATINLANMTNGLSGRWELYKNNTSLAIGNDIVSIFSGLVGSYCSDHSVIAGDYFDARITILTDTSVDIMAVSTFEIQALDPPGGGVSDADKGDITVTSSGTVWTIDSNIISTTNTEASRPAASKAGAVFFPSNGFSIARDTASAYSLWGPIFALTDPATSAPTTWVNQGAASVDSTNGGIFLLAPVTAGTNERLRVKTAPATPYTITAAFIPNFLSVGGGPHVGLAFRQSSDGKLHECTYQDDSGIEAGGTLLSRVYSLKYTSATAFSATYHSYPTIINGPVVWLQISDNGTNRFCRISRDGVHFLEVTSIGRTDFLTADQIGFSVGNATTFDAGAQLISWKEQ